MFASTSEVGGDGSGEDNGDFHPNLFNIRLGRLIVGGDSAAWQDCADCESESLAARPPGESLARLESEAE